MKIEEIMKGIRKGNIGNGALFHGGDLIYKIIVADNRLYFLNIVKHEFVLVDSSDIAHMIDENIELYKYRKIID